jgi:glycosyltransferase involved in cell wall biosynthesis
MTTLSLPLISCLMPTADRRPFVQIALDTFRSQTYPRKELLVIDDGIDPVEDIFRGAADVRYFRVPRISTIGSKRNLGWREARGSILAQWDDDDWYGPDRLLLQAAPILLDEADMTGMEASFVLELPAAVLWRMTPDLEQRAFPSGFHSGTIAFRRSLADRGVAYPDGSAGEDVELIRRTKAIGGRLWRIRNQGSFVFVRHQMNTWSDFVPGRYIDPAGWIRVEAPPELSPETLGAYRAAAGYRRPLSREVQNV